MQYEDYLRYGYGWGMDDVGVAEGAPDSSDSAGDADPNSGREEGVDFSGTNNQEEGVDEADFVKTDGYFIYALHGGQLRIFEVPEFGDLVHMSRTNIEGYPTSMLLDGDRLVVFSNVYTWNLPEGDPLRELVGDEYTSTGAGTGEHKSWTKSPSWTFLIDWLRQRSRYSSKAGIRQHVKSRAGYAWSHIHG